MSTVERTREEVEQGSCSALLDGVDVRYVRFGETEIVRRVFVAVRDVTWKTVLAEVEELTVERGAEETVLSFAARYRGAGIDVSGRGRFALSGQGLRSEVELSANADTRYARMGLCVLHPCELLAGRTYLARTEDGPLSGTFPQTIGPQRFRDDIYSALFGPFTALEIDMDGVLASFGFEGDVFELEDQRNWTDASFKTYSTALSLGFPHELRAGETLSQTVTLTCTGTPSPRRWRPDSVPVRIGPPSGAVLPPIGLGQASHGQPLSATEAEMLGKLELGHLRVDVDLTAEDWAERLAAGQDAAAAIGCGIELAVFVDALRRRRLGELREALERRGAADVRRVLAFHQGTETTPRPWVPEYRRQLEAALPGVPFAGGTNVFFTEINRGRPDPGTMDGIAWSINASVHATDELSIMETIPAQADQVASAHTLWPRTKLFVGPVTLRMRWNAHARGREDVEEEGVLPFPVDARQRLPFAAAWAAGSIGQLTRAGVDSLTYFETTGWRGLIETGEPEDSRLFPSSPGEVFPVYEVFAALAGWRGAEALAVEVDDGRRVQALALRRGTSVRVLVANLGDRPERAALEGAVAEQLELEPYGLAVADFKLA
ncbi:MAG TPA: hypothetical protein VMS60_00450 [Solirubrobacterales bacterium]|nr:hypothetical protein [Solirubrobacterales bacterium]